MIYFFFFFLDKKSTGRGANFIPNQQIENELHKSIIRNVKKKKNVYSSFQDIWGVDLADMELISKYNKGIRYLLCATDLFSKYAWVVHLKSKKVITIVNEFQIILDSSKTKPNKIWVNQDSEFCNTFFKKCLKENHKEMYSTCNEGYMLLVI